jgi:hypothetical protein
MSILIKGMEMPETCRDCRFSTVIAFDKRPLCDALVEYMSYGEWEAKRLDNCPLIPAPPHGRLIDADALTEKLKKHREYHLDGSNSGAAISNGIGQCLDIINGRECPTIIPAEEGE